MLNLVRNENMKIYRRMRTWVMVLILMVICVAGSIISKNVSSGPDEGDWRTQVQSEIDHAKSTLAQKDLPDGIKDKMRQRIAVDEYRLAHNLSPESGMWSGIMSMAGLISFVTIFTTIIAADIVAGEFAGGTIKLLLIRPASRSKILLSKYMATLLFAVFLLAVLFVTSFVTNGILFGMKDVGAPYLVAGKDLVVHQVTMIGHVLATYGLKCIELVMVVTLGFMISTAFRSSLLSIGISLLVMFLGTNVILLLRKYSWVKYYLFANTDLTQYLEGQPLFEGMTLSFSIMVLLVYFLVFNAVAWTIFNKRDVAA